MVICVCANVNTEAIKEALCLRNSFEHVCDTTGACKCCKRCKESIEELITEHPPTVDLDPISSYRTHIINPVGHTP